MKAYLFPPMVDAGKSLVSTKLSSYGLRLSRRLPSYLLEFCHLLQTCSRSCSGVSIVMHACRISETVSATLCSINASQLACNAFGTLASHSGSNALVTAARSLALRNGVLRDFARAQIEQKLSFFRTIFVRSNPVVHLLRCCRIA